MQEAPTRRLYRSRDQRLIAGVAGGIAEYLNVDPTIIRLIWVIAGIVAAPAALVLYVAMALVIPLEPPGQ